VELKLNGIHQLLVYDVINLSGDNITTTKKNTEALTGSRTGIAQSV
jgi:hypothetical protein